MKIRLVTIEPKDMKRFGVTITAGYAFAHRYHWRVRLGMFLIRLAGLVAGVSVEEEAEPCN
jgi:hypothetical protein